MKKIDMIKEKFRQHSIDEHDVAWLIQRFDIAENALSAVCEKSKLMCIINICLDALAKMSYHRAD